MLDSTDGSSMFSDPDISNYVCNEEKIEDDLRINEEVREWKDYLRSLWRAVLREKQLNLEQRGIHKYYWRRQALSLSGWVGRVGYRKRRN